MQLGVRQRSWLRRKGYVGRRKTFSGVQNSVLNGKYVNIALNDLKIKSLPITACSIE